MPEITILTEAELRSVMHPGPETRAAVEAVFAVITAGKASMPPIMRIDVPAHNGEVDIKSAHLPNLPGIAIKVSAGFFDNPVRGLPSLGGLMVVLDAETGIPQAVLLDNGYLTDLRTALAGAVAADHLARRDATRIAVLGAGVQARLQVAALADVRSIEHVTVWARREDAARELAHELASSMVDVATAVAASPAAGVAADDIVVTTTPSTTPLVTAAMLHPGLHITAVGSDAEHKQELDADVVMAADRFVCDVVDQSSRLGELRAAVAAGFDPTAAVELGAVIAGTAPGRSGNDDITVCDLTGTGAQDTAIAGVAVARCRAAGLGQIVVN